MRRATLVQIDEEDGILYPPHSQCGDVRLSRNAEEPIAYRLPGETLSEGMFVIWPVLGNGRSGCITCRRRTLQPVFGRSASEKNSDTRRRLFAAITRRWHRTQEPSRLVSASGADRLRPLFTLLNRRRHFETLITVLSIDHDATVVSSRALRRPWWKYAWNEIGHARGEAIQSGMQEHEIIDEQLS